MDVADDMPLLWVLRDELGLVGTKYGCGIGSCGSCKVFIDDKAFQSCSIQIKDVTGEVTTIEGLTSRFSSSESVIKAWIENQVAQCGYCQPGQIIATVALLMQFPNPTEEVINEQLAGNLCRCGTYPKIKKAIESMNNDDKVQDQVKDQVRDIDGQ